MILYRTIPYHTIPYHTIPYHTIPYDTIRSDPIRYYTIPCYAMLYYTILYYSILYYTILDYTILYYTILSYTNLYYTMYCTLLHHAIPYWGSPKQEAPIDARPKAWALLGAALGLGRQGLSLCGLQAYANIYTLYKHTRLCIYLCNRYVCKYIYMYIIYIHIANTST